MEILGPRLVAVACLAALGCTGPNPDFDRPSQSRDAPGADGVLEAGPADLAPEGAMAFETGSDAVLDTPAHDGFPADASVPDAADAVVPDGPGPPDLGADLPADRPLDLAADAPAPPDAAPDSSLTVELLVRYRLDPSGGSAVPDDSGGRSGTRSGAGTTWVTTGLPAPRFPNPGALSFDGSGYATLPTAGFPGVSAERSVSVWFWAPLSTGVFRRTLLSISNPGAEEGFHLGLQRGVPAVWAWAQSSDSPPLLSDAGVHSGGWAHLAYTHRAGTHSLYLDGVRVDVVTFTYGVNTPTTLLLLGAWSTSTPNERWSGQIDDLRIYDRALSAAEVADLAGGAP